MDVIPKRGIGHFKKVSYIVLTSYVIVADSALAIGSAFSVVLVKSIK